MTPAWRKLLKRRYLARAAATQAPPSVTQLWRCTRLRERAVFATIASYYASEGYCAFGQWQRAYGIATIPSVVRLAPSQWTWRYAKEATRARSH